MCAVVITRIYSRQSPGVVIGRYTELVEIALSLTYAPLICLMLDLFRLARGWGG